MEISPADGEVDDCWVLLLNEIVLGEPLVVHDYVWWEPGAAISFQLTGKLLQYKIRSGSKGNR